MTTAEMSAPPASEDWTNSWWLLLLQGIAAIIIGILLLTDPGATLITLVFFLGVWWFVAGIFDLVQVFLDKANWGWHLVAGILGIIAGLILVRHPLWSTLLVPDTLVWLLGLIGIVVGGIGLIQAFRGRGWGHGIAGALSIIFGGLLLVVSPLASLTLVWAMTAAFALVGGIAAIVMAFRLRNA